MNGEEKKAIEYLKEVKSWWWHNSPDKAYAINLSDIKQFDILLNLIERQQKEIADLKQINEEHRKLNGTLREEINKLKKEKEDILYYMEE